MLDFSSPQVILVSCIKILLGIIDLGIVIFALLVLRQVSIMNTNLKTPLAPAIGIMAFIHFIVAILVAILLLVILFTA
jgi:hypothetical protein